MIVLDVVIHVVENISMTVLLLYSSSSSSSILYWNFITVVEIQHVSYHSESITINHKNTRA